MKLTLANTAWFVLVWLFYLALPEWREVLPALILAILLWRIQEIARFRPDWSWLEKWPFLLKLEKGKITGYHLSGGGALTVCFLLTPPEMSQIEFLWQGGLLIALLGYTSNHFYHVAFMDGKIFKPVDGVVELPRKVDHPDLTPVVAPKKAPAKGKAKNDNA